MNREAVLLIVEADSLLDWAESHSYPGLLPNEVEPALCSISWLLPEIERMQRSDSIPWDRGDIDPRDELERLDSATTELLRALEREEPVVPESAIARMRTAVSRLQASVGSSLAVAGTLPAAAVPQPPRPADLLTSWREITEALDMRHDDQGKVKSLNERYDGPIPKPPKGGQPIVEKGKLLSWWNSLAVMQQESANREQGRRLAAAETHPFGRDGEAAPEIGGGVKRRRNRTR